MDERTSSENQDLRVGRVESASLKEKTAWKVSSNTVVSGPDPMMGARLVFEYHFANKADDELDLGIPLER